jgi:hypothetical protein
MEEANGALQILNQLNNAASYAKWLLGVKFLILLLLILVLGWIVKFWLPIAKHQRVITKDTEDKYHEFKKRVDELEVESKQNKIEYEKATGALKEKIRTLEQGDAQAKKYAAAIVELVQSQDDIFNRYDNINNLVNDQIKKISAYSYTYNIFECFNKKQPPILYMHDGETGKKDK